VEYGTISFGGSVWLGGALSVSLEDGFVPGVGESFAILKWAGKRGGFIEAIGFDLGEGLFFQGIGDGSGLSLVTKTTVVPTPPPPTNLVDRVVAFGDPALFSFSPLGVAPFSYQWTFNGTNLPGQTGASLTILDVQAADLGTYCAVVVDAFDVTNSYCAQLSAIEPPGITSQPSGSTNNSGANITLTATGNGGGPLRYQWRINGANIPGATNSSYTIVNAQPRDGGTYSVLVANPVRVISSSNAKVQILSPSLPLGDNFPGGSTNSFSGVGSASNTNATHEAGEPDHAGKPGTRSLWLQWTAPASGVVTFNTRGSSFDTLLGVYVSTNGTATVSNLASVAQDDDRAGYFTSEAVFNAQSGTNYYIAVDGLAAYSGDIVLSWNLDTNLTEIPRILQHPVDVGASPGGTASFDVFAASTTNLTYQWLFGGWLAVAGATNATLTLTNVGYLDVGNYSVEVTSATGQTVESLAANLEIGFESDSTSFDKLEDLLLDEAAPQGGGVVSIASFPSVTIGTLGSQIINNFNSTTQQGEPIHSSVIGGASRWYKLTAGEDATLVIDTLGSDIDTVLAVYTGTDIFTLSLVAEDNNGAPDGVRSRVGFAATTGQEYLVAVDGLDGAQGNILLNWRMGIPPNVISDAQKLILVGGSSLLLEAGVDNDVTAPTYQWRRNGDNIVGATNTTYTIPILRFDHVGSYSVWVSNLVGEVINPIATISTETPLRAGLGEGGINLSGSATQTMVLELSTDLKQWVPIYTNTTPLLPVDYTDTNAPGRNEGYYRLEPWP
jgi:hypothetical protein